VRLRASNGRFADAKTSASVLWMKDYIEKNVLTEIDDIRPSVKNVISCLEKSRQLSDERRYEIELVLNELLVNSFRHARPSLGEPVVLTAGVEDGKLKICVTDSGDGFEHRKEIDSASDSSVLLRECGRGLMLVKAFCEEIRYNLKGNSVEVEIAL
jgi:serine/threonine-protein kinase RsbW